MRRRDRRTRSAAAITQIATSRQRLRRDGSLINPSVVIDAT
jgi:hypothetical protein